MGHWNTSKVIIGLWCFFTLGDISFWREPTEWAHGFDSFFATCGACIFGVVIRYNHDCFFSIGHKSLGVRTVVAASDSTIEHLRGERHVEENAIFCRFYRASPEQGVPAWGSDH